MRLMKEILYLVQYMHLLEFLLQSSIFNKNFLLYFLVSRYFEMIIILLIGQLASSLRRLTPIV